MGKLQTLEDAKEILLQPCKINNSLAKKRSTVADAALTNTDALNLNQIDWARSDLTHYRMLVHMTARIFAKKNFLKT